jgi:DNA-binding CsgD family transcriptional regulator
LLVAPLRSVTDWLVPRAGSAIVFVADPDALPTTSVEQLRRFYGLTPAEATVAVAVLQGKGVKAIADGLGISVPTARTHLHRVFEKTGTQRQAESFRSFLTAAFPSRRAG